MIDITDTLHVTTIMFPIILFIIYYFKQLERQEFSEVHSRIIELQKDINKLATELYETEIKSLKLMDKVKCTVDNPLSRVVD